jgi:hypothetical protein
MRHTPQEKAILIDRSPLAWLAMADLLEERGNPESAVWRLMASWGDKLLRSWIDLAHSFETADELVYLTRKTDKTIICLSRRSKFSVIASFIPNPPTMGTCRHVMSAYIFKSRYRDRLWEPDDDYSHFYDSSWEWVVKRLRRICKAFVEAGVTA